MAKPMITQPTPYDSIGILVCRCPKDLGKIQTASSPTALQIEVGSVQIGDFRPISRYISETVQDKDIVTMGG